MNEIPNIVNPWFWSLVRCSLLVASLVGRHYTLSWFSAKEKKRMNEIPNIVIPAPGGQRVGTPPPRLRSISLNLQSPAADPLWIHSIQLLPPWIQYSMWTHLLYHHSGCWPLCTFTGPQLYPHHSVPPLYQYLHHSVEPLWLSAQLPWVWMQWEGTTPTFKAQNGHPVDLCLFSCRFNSFVVNWWNQYTTMRGRTFKSSIWTLTAVRLRSFKCQPNFSGAGLGPHL